MTQIQRFLRYWPLLFVTACGAAPEATSDGAGAPESEPVSLEGWASETIPLPPQFAPGLPSGTEELRFAPGWRDPKAEDFWSYAFVMWIDESAPDADRLDEMLEDYYDGLMTAVAGSKERDVGSDPAQIEVRRTAPNRFEVRMHLIDTFTTFEPIDLVGQIESEPETEARTILRVRVSPQPEEHEVWRSLEAAIADILEL